MPVKVWKANNEPTTHSAGDDVLIDEGHLVVTAKLERVALYAPGQWKRAEVQVSSAS